MNQSIKKLITCKWCKSILDEPVFLPCSETVCRKHSIEINNKQCRFCDKVHVLKEAEQFPANKIVQDLFELKIKELDFGLSHKNASERLNELSGFLNDYNSIKEHPEAYFSEHFNKQRNKVDLVREKLFLEINKISEKLILKIDLEEELCKASLSKFNLSSLGDDLVSTKADLSKWEQDMKYLVVNDNLWTSISTKCSEYMKQLKRSRLDLEVMFLGKPSELKTESYLFDTFIYDLMANEGSLQMKIHKLSSYTTIENLMNVDSANILFLKNLPFKILVQIGPNGQKNDFNIGIFVDNTLIKEIYKTRKWTLEYGFKVAIFNNSGGKVYQLGDLSHKFIKSSTSISSLFGYRNTKILEDLTLDAYNKEDDSMVVEIQVRLMDFKIAE